MSAPSNPDDGSKPKWRCGRIWPFSRKSGDNLKWLRDPKIFPEASVDLVYLDPPFNSNADYNVLFREACQSAT
jgi:16S rRNA G966 N2-methylase RsmD